MYYFGDVMYAMGLDITKKVCVKFGQTDDYEKKFCNFDEVVSLVNKALKEPENIGTYQDCVDLCKLYDKNENGKMMLAELENILCHLGDEIPKEDVIKLLEDYAGKEDNNGFIRYMPFINKVTGKKA
jgi:Ca2+-binding EF-hand superfamily protein